MKTLFVDMDGTLCEWRPSARIEDLYEPGYFLGLAPHSAVVEAIRFIALRKRFEVKVLSAVLTDSLYAQAEKVQWLQYYLPFIDENHIIFSLYGGTKSGSIGRPLTKEDFLLDDYSKNLHEWEMDGGTGIKLMNGLNGTNGTWQKAKVTYNPFSVGQMDGLHLASEIERIMQGHE